MPNIVDLESIASRLMGADRLEDVKPELLWELEELNRQIEARLDSMDEDCSPEHAGELLESILSVSELFAQLKEWQRSVQVLHGIGKVHGLGLCDDSMADDIKLKGKLCRSKAKWEAAIEAYKIASTIYSSSGNTVGVAEINNVMGITNFESGNWKDAEVYYLTALELIEDKSPDLRAKINNNLGALYNARGDRDNAMASYLRSIPDFQKTANHLGLAQAYHNLGISYMDKKDWINAEKFYELSLEISKRLDVDDLTALSYINLASLYIKSSSPAQAEAYCRTAITMLMDQDDRLGLAEAHKIMGVVESFKKNWQEARSHFEFSIEMNEKCSSPLGLAEVYYEFGRMCRDAGKTEEAHKLLNKSLELFENLRALQNVEDVRTEVHQIDELYLDTIETLGSAVEDKDHYTMGHSSRVAHFSLKLAEALRLDEDTKKGIVISAYLHDIGKIYVPDKILNKPGKLTDEEFETIKRHPEMGIVSLSSVEFPWQVKQNILHHHERLDGSGYPCGLRGEEIPLGAQIIAISDFFDALTTDRSYRKAWSQEKAITIIAQNQGILFEENIVLSFLGLIELGRIKAEPGQRYRIAELWKSFSTPKSVSLPV